MYTFVIRPNRGDIYVVLCFQSAFCMLYYYYWSSSHQHPVFLEGCNTLFHLLLHFCPCSHLPCSQELGFACQCHRVESSFLAALNTQVRGLKGENLLLTFQTLTSKEPCALSDSWDWWGWWVMAAILPSPLLSPLEYIGTARLHAVKWPGLLLLLSPITISTAGHLTVCCYCCLKT